MGRPTKGKKPSVYVAVRVRAELHERVAEAVKEDATTMTAAVEDGLERHLRARARRQRKDRAED